MSLREEDVKKVTRLTGIPAFKAQQEERGAALIGDLPMEGTDNVIQISQPVAPAPVPGDSSPATPQGPGASGNWSYQGQPGVTDAFAPPSAVQQSPGDVPKAAPTPRPQR